MNIQEYISSGVVEAYILGSATSAEVIEIEQLMTQYPELEAAIQEQESLMGKYAQMNSVPPPPHLKNVIWQALQQEIVGSTKPKNAPHISLSEKGTTDQTGIRKYALAASIALLIASGIGNVWMMNKHGEMKGDIVALQSKEKALLADKENAIAAAQKANNSLQVLELPKLVKINLAGVGMHTAHSGMLYWDGATGDVYIDLNSMPKAPLGKQYQLWAIVDGKPIDAGMYDGNIAVAMHKMKTIPKAEMFAITIENAGGSPSPTLDQMVVAGKTS